MLTFLLVGIGHVGMLMAWRNLIDLRITGLGASPVYAGQSAMFAVQIENRGNDQRYAVTLCSQTKIGDTIDIQPGTIATARFSQPVSSRGYFNPGRVKIMTEFPLGLFVAWTWVDLSMQCLVYPAPAAKVPHIPSIDSQAGEEQAEGVGLEDFAGLRKLQPGDSWRRISWKAAARLDELYSKEFTGGHPERQWIDWVALDEPSLEVRLSMMTRLVIDAQEAGRQYGLRLPSMEIDPQNGHEHKHQCLKALALYRLEEQVDV